VEGYKKASNLKYCLLDKSNLQLENVDIVIMALANDESESYVNIIKKNYPNIIFIDLSSDHRLDTRWDYRVPELTTKKATKFISNPGCYASAIQFSLAPIKNLISGRVSSIGISGYSGAGASPNDKNNPVNLKNNIIPYSLTNHLHEQEVSKHCHEEISFSPHVGNFFRGILITSHIQLKTSQTNQEILETFVDFYKNSKLIEVLDDIPMINKVANTHKALIGGISIDNSGVNLTVCCALDNLLKGAATQVIQNLNSACSLDELTGIEYE
jgi:N-acetyl-gamma-glutamyl-phosphate reductase common form